MSRYFCIGDIHGDSAKLFALFHYLTNDHGFAQVKGDTVVQLGDKNDRGPDTHGVFEFFKTMKAQHPEETVLLLGNHEHMMLSAALASTGESFDPNSAESFWIPQNGGPATLASYEDATGLKGARGLGNMLNLTGHLKFLIHDHVLLMEDEQYIFCHAPIGKYPPKDWRMQSNYLMWNHGPNNNDWVSRDVDGKIAVHGHIHNLKYKGGYGGTIGNYVVPPVRRYGNSFLVDTGCGCADNAPLSCLILPDMLVVNSDGETYSMKTQEEIENAR